MLTVPGKVAEFTTRHLETIDDLQVLIACMENRDRWWSTESAAHQLGITRAIAGRSLDHLARQNLFDIRIRDDIRYRFAPGTPGLEAEALAWLLEYRKNPLGIVKLVTGSRSIRDFADAFRIKRYDDR